MAVRRPDFLVIGAQRSATSWLYFCLREHPQIFLPFKKEVEYFTKYYHEGPAWYARYFELCGKEQICGEISPSYLYDPAAPERIRRDLPGVKLLAVFRHPVERAYSQYLKRLRAGERFASFEEAIGKDAEFIQRGMYFTQISRYVSRFGPGQIHWMAYDDIQTGPGRLFEEIFGFLGVGGAFRPSAAQRVLPSENLGTGILNPAVKMSHFVRHGLKAGRLVDWLKKTPARRGYDRLMQRFGTRPRTRRESALAKTDGLGPALKERLAGLYSVEVTRLSELMKRDLNLLWGIPKA